MREKVSEKERKGGMEGEEGGWWKGRKRDREGDGIIDPLSPAHALTGHLIHQPRYVPGIKRATFLVHRATIQPTKPTSQGYTQILYI